MNDQKPEIVDLVDDNDNVIGQVERNDSINNLKVHGGRLRVVDCYILNSKGELWVPRRTAQKRIAPNGLDFSIGEHMQHGETYEEAMARGFREEVGFEPDKGKLELIGVSKPEQDSDMFQGFFIYHSDEAPRLNPEDFVSAEWIRLDDLIQKIESGDVAKPNILPTLKKYSKQLTSIKK